jgi:bifunctional enzyme CysN/CysC
VGNRFDALMCWMSETPLDQNVSYVMMHTTRTVRAFVNQVAYRIDVDTLHRETGVSFGLNDIGRAEITTSAPIFFDPYMQNNHTGSFILVDPFTNVTVAAGMIRGEARTDQDVAPTAVASKSPDVVWQDWNVSATERAARNAHKPLVLWFTGLSGSGKSTIARGVERELFAAGYNTMLLDGDQLRHGLNGDLGFSPGDRKENIRRAAEVARLFYHNGAIVLCTFVSPFAADRDFARSLIPDGDFIEIFVDTPLEVCQERDPKGLYQRAGEGQIRNLTGVGAAYEPPADPEVVVRGVEPAQSNIDALVKTVSERAPRGEL